MLIVLPPSEGKVRPADGPALDLGTLSFPMLGRTRRTVLDALIRLCRADPAIAASILGLGSTQADEVRHNIRLRQAPAAPAIEVYSGVLYEALDARSLSRAGARRLQSSVAISSSLFGLLRPHDRIPAYRLSGDTALPPIGPLAAAWRSAMHEALAATRGPILDLRSGAYVALGPIPETIAPRALIGRVLRDHGGRRSVVSHHNKATKGRLVRALVESGPMPTTLNGLLNALPDLGFPVELHESEREGQPARLDIVVRDV